MIHLRIPPSPIFTTPGDTLQDLTTISTLSMYMRYYYQKDQLRATATGYFNETKHNFMRITKSREGVQWAFYSAHDTSVMNYITQMGLTNVDCIYQNYLNGTVKNS